MSRACAASALVALFLTACPHLPPPAPRPHAHLLAMDRASGGITARLRVDDAAALHPVAVDWALAVGERDLVRGRADSLEIAIRLPPEVRPGTLVRLRGAVHLDGTRGGALAPFDELLRLP